MKYEYPVFISTQKSISFNSESIEAIDFAESDSKKAKRIFKYINSRSKALLDSLKKDKYKHLSDIQHKVEFVETKEGNDGFNFLLYATEDRDCQELLLDFVEMTINELNYILYRPQEQLKIQVMIKMDSISKEMEKMLDIPREELDKEKLRKLNKIYTHLLEKRTELEISEAGQTSPFFYLYRKPRKLKLED